MFAKQAEFIEWGRAFVFHAQTLRKQQQAAVVWHGGELVAPHFVVEEYSGVVQILGIDAGAFDNSIGVPFQFIDEKRRCQLVATRFYISTLGLTRDPFMMTGTNNMWVNAGRTQFHLPDGNPQRFRGTVTLVMSVRLLKA